MPMKTALAILSLFVISIQAADLVPDLMPSTEKYESESITLQVQKAAAVKRAQEPYVAALDAADRQATTAGNVPLVSAINKERSSIGPVMAPASPPDLPKVLESARRKLIEELARIEKNFIATQQRIDADYMRALGALQAKATGDPVLTQQVGEQKKKLLAGIRPVAKPAGTTASATTPTTAANPSAAPAAAGGSSTMSNEQLAKELDGHWFWNTEKLWVAISPNGKAYLDTLKLSWSAGEDGSVIFVDLANPQSKAVCRFDFPGKSFTGTGFDGKPVTGTLKMKR